MLTCRLCTKIAAVVPLIAVPSVQGVILYSSGDPTSNTTAPTGSLLNSGWQYEGVWSGFLGTPVGPNHFLTAAHIGGGTGSPFIYNGVTYTTVAFPDAASVKNFGDLRLYRVDKTFTSYAPLYDATVDGLETAKSVTVFGRGRQRGAEIRVGGVLKGWNWGTADGVQRWGENKVSAIQSYEIGGDQKLLEFKFDASGSGYSGVNEATMAEGDSGGGLFINVGGQWKLAGINYAVSGPYSYGPDDATFLAAVFDTGGLYDRKGTPVLISDTAADKPSLWYASRVSASLASIKSFLNLPPTWKLNNTGVWSNDPNWANTATAPNAVDAIADFRTVITTARTVTLDAARTVGTLNIDSSQPYTLAGSSALTLDVSSGSAAVNVASGNHTISAPLTLNDAAILNVIPSTSTLTISGALTATGKTITKQGQGVAELSVVRSAGLAVSQGRVKLLAGGGASANRVSSLTVAAGAKLDLDNNHIVVDYSATSVLGTWTGSAYSGLQGLVDSALSSGTWNGNGITSSTAAGTSGLFGVGIAEASAALGISGSNTAAWKGQTVDSSTILLGYTYRGDLNLNGLVNGEDYFFIDYAVAVPNSSGYSNGDLNFDGLINGDDYSIIDFNYGLAAHGAVPLAASAPLLSVVVVPEPGATAFIAFSVMTAFGRRQRRRG